MVISAVLGFLNLAAMERVRRLRHDSFVIALVVLVAVLVLGVLQGLILGVVISVGVFLIWASRPSSSVRTGPGLLVYRGRATPPPRSGSSCSTCRSPQGSTSRA